MLVKDEDDILAYTLEHLLGEVDHVFVSDNGSTDGTREILAGYPTDNVTVTFDADPAYYQAEKTSELARIALERGFQWVVPCDADEFWYSTDGRKISELLAGLAPDVAYVQAPLFNHLASALDPPAICSGCGRGAGLLGTGYTACTACGGQGGEPNPFRRIGWRQREHGQLPKVAARLRPGLEIRQGNHSAWAPGNGVTAGGLVVRHFSWRSEEQYLRKIRNGEAAYAATKLAPDVGAHWRMWQGHPDDAVREHFRTWFWSADPAADPTLIYDPAPVR